MERFKLGEWVRLSLVSLTGCNIKRYIKVYDIKECNKAKGYNCYGISCKKCPGYFINHYGAFRARKLTRKEREQIALFILTYPNKEMIENGELK